MECCQRTRELCSLIALDALRSILTQTHALHAKLLGLARTRQVNDILTDSNYLASSITREIAVLERSAPKSETPMPEVTP